MKKFLLIAFVSIFSLVSLWAVGNESMTLNAIVPEDFGVEFPPEAVRLDRFVFEIDSENEQHQLLDSWMFPIGIVEDNFGYREITLLYYGNSSKAYDVILSFNMGDMTLNGEPFGDSIPFWMEFERSEDADDDIQVFEDQDSDSVRVYIPSAGERLAVPVVDIRFYWDISGSVLPGEYAAELSIELLENN